MLNEHVIYSGDGVPPTGNLLYETKFLLEDLRDLAKEESVSIELVAQLYQCKVEEYKARMLYQCADSIARIDK